MKTKTLLILWIAFLSFERGNSQSLFMEASHEIEEKVEKLLQQMTLAEKIGQLNQSNANGVATGPQKAQDDFYKQLEAGRIGSILNIAGVEEIRKYQEIAVTRSRLKIPLLFGYDVIHGYKTIFPIPLAESCSWDLELMEKSARIAAKEAAAAGLHWTFAPMIDVSRDPRWGRVLEGAGEDTWLTSRVAEAKVRGYQWNLGSNESVLACAKHFAAYGLPQAGKDYGTVDISERTLEEIYLPPFKAAVEAGVATFMPAFNDIAGVPCTANKWLLTEVLRNRWKFKGVVVSDWGAIWQLVPHGMAHGSKQAVELSINAGVDMDMADGEYNRHALALINEGKVTVGQIDEMVRRILRMKFKLGLFDDPFRFCDVKREKRVIRNCDFIAEARKAAQKSIVLLKNENHLLPLAKDIKSIAVVGPLADNKQYLRDYWAGKGEVNDYVTLLEGLKNNLPSHIKINYAKGCDVTGTDCSFFSEAVEAANQSELVIAAIGERASMSGEDASRADISIPGVQEELVQALLDTGKPVVVVLMNGRPLTISKLTEQVPAIVEGWFLGTETGNAIADVLLGKYNPSGKLTMSFPRNVGQIPVFYNYRQSGRPGTDKLTKWTNRFIDSPVSPLYPFGYGLSYTTFSYSAPRVSQKEFSTNEILKVSVDVTNTGQYDGEETIQLYIRDVIASVTRPVKELKGFKKIFLRKGETRTVGFELRAEDLSFLSQDMEPVIESGEFILMTGPNSKDVQSVKVKFVKP